MSLICQQTLIREPVKSLYVNFLGLLFSENEHGVTVAVKAVIFFNGLLVELVQPFNAFAGARGEEGGDQAEEGGFGQVEIGDEMIDARKGRGRVDKDVGLRLKGTIGEVGDPAVLLQALKGVFHRTDAGGSDRDAGTGGRIL